MAATGKKEEQFVVLDGVEGKWYHLIGEKIIMGPPIQRLVFSPDSQHFAYVARDAEGFFVVQDGVEGKKYPSGVLTPVFSPDSKRMAYGGSETEGTWCVVLDGVEGTKYGTVAQFTFSPDSSRFAYWGGSIGRQCVVVDGVEGKTYSNPYYAPITPRMGPMESVSIAFSPDSKRVIYLAQNGMSRCIVIVDGVESKEYVRIFDLVMTSDSKHIAYRAGLGQRAIWVLDGQEVIVRDLNAMTGLTFDSPTKCHGIANGNAAFLIEIEIAP
jgi:hypothetical protein